MPGWSPEAWNSFGVAGLAVFVLVGIFVALARGWIVFGPHHREIVASKDSTIADLRASDANKDDTISVQAKALLEKNSTEDAMTRILSAIRDMAARP